ncbi:30S ribosomal protein S3 [Niabella sp. W65]|nr:30S ribosomal protein S3 [Niabella sp. W65]MCH7363308.1 30S ribosomal protein S3 [Niabella sp. W65]
MKKLTGNDDVQINILEIRRPETDAMIVGDTIARQIENRINFKRATKMAIASALRMGAEGIKVKLSGRLNGAEIARSEEFKQGRVPLHTFRMDIDYANVFAQTVYGKIGIKVWICKGEVLTKRDLNRISFPEMIRTPVLVAVSAEIVVTTGEVIAVVQEKEKLSFNMTI